MTYIPLAEIKAKLATHKYLVKEVRTLHGGGRFEFREESSYTLVYLSRDANGKAQEHTVGPIRKDIAKYAVAVCTRHWKAYSDKGIFEARYSAIAKESDKGNWEVRHNEIVKEK